MPITSHLIRHAARLLHGAALAALVLPGVALAKQQKPVLTYFLPKASVSASVSQRIVSCPAFGKGDIEVETTWTITPKSVPDYARPISLDASAGAFVNRTVALTLNEDGTLAAINASAESQVPEVLGSVIQLAGTLAPMLAGLPPVPAFNMLAMRAGFLERGTQPIVVERCNEATRNLLGRYAALSAKISDIEDAIAADSATSAQIALLPALKARFTVIGGELTLTGKAPDDLNKAISALAPCTSAGTCNPEGTVIIAALDYQNWFENPNDSTAGLPGSHGFIVKWAASKAAASALVSAGDAPPPSSGQRQLIYRRAVPTMIYAGACADAPTNATCTLDESPIGEAASAIAKFAIPQLSPDFRLSIGTGGIFGSTSVAAKFDSWGRPTALSYGSNAGGDKLAGLIGTAGDAATKIDGAKLEALNNRNALLEARAKYLELTE